MRLSRIWGRTRAETIELLNNEDEFIWQLAHEAIDPIADEQLNFAYLIESSLKQGTGKRLEIDRWLSEWHPTKKPKPKMMTSEQCKAAFAQVSRSTDSI